MTDHESELNLAGDWFDGLASTLLNQYDLPDRLRQQLVQTERYGLLLAGEVERARGQCDCGRG